MMSPNSNLPVLQTGRRPFQILGLLSLGMAFAVPCGCTLLFPPSPVPTATTVSFQLVAQGLTSPVCLVSPPDGSTRRFVVDQVGKIFIIDAGGVLLPTPFLDVSARMVALSATGDERGLLSMAFHPSYAANGRFFVFYSAPPGPTTPAGYSAQSHLSEFSVSPSNPNLADPNSEQILLRVDKPQSNHNGGQLAFGPDGFLYAGTGDGGGASDVGAGHTPGLGNAQDKSQLLGKILRIDVDHGAPYTIPADNPLVSDPNARGEIWAYGLRNPWRFSFDTGGARTLYAGDAGQALFEEVDIITKGGNYGWNRREGLHCYDPNTPLNPPAACATVGADGLPFIDPIIEYPHSGAAGALTGDAVIGGYLYRGSAVPGLQGRYVFGDLTTAFPATGGRLFVAEQASGGTWSLLSLTFTGSAIPTGRLLLGFGQDAQGELYVLTSAHGLPTGTTGQVHKIVAGP
jgi:glucose/arabinose dehydrogenase